jgi:hypothetical protein
MEMEQRPEVLRAKCPRVYPYTSYFKEEVAAIIDLIQAKSSSDEPGKSAPQSALGGGITQIVYHARHPKIGFVGKKTDSVVEELQKVLLAMEEFAREHGLTNLESNHESDGCHLCLHLGSGTYIYIPVNFHINYLNPNLNPKINPDLSSNSIYAASNIFYFKIILYFFPPVTCNRRLEFHEKVWGRCPRIHRDYRASFLPTVSCVTSRGWFTAFQQSCFKCLT